MEMKITNAEVMEYVRSLQANVGNKSEIAKLLDNQYLFVAYLRSMGVPEEWLDRLTILEVARTEITKALENPNAIVTESGIVSLDNEIAFKDGEFVLCDLPDRSIKFKPSVYLEKPREEGGVEYSLDHKNASPHLVDLCINDKGCKSTAIIDKSGLVQYEEYTNYRIADYQGAGEGIVQGGWRCQRIHGAQIVIADMENEDKMVVRDFGNPMQLFVPGVEYDIESSREPLLIMSKQGLIYVDGRNEHTYMNSNISLRMAELAERYPQYREWLENENIPETILENQQKAFYKLKPIKSDWRPAALAYVNTENRIVAFYRDIAKDPEKKEAYEMLATEATEISGKDEFVMWDRMDSVIKLHHVAEGRYAGKTEQDVTATEYKDFAAVTNVASSNTGIKYTAGERTTNGSPMNLNYIQYLLTVAVAVDRILAEENRILENYTSFASISYHTDLRTKQKAEARFIQKVSEMMEQRNPNMRLLEVTVANPHDDHEDHEDR